MTLQQKKRLRVTFNAPVVLSFVLACTVVFLVSLVWKWPLNHLFCVSRTSLARPLTYVRLFGHVLGHASWEHLLGNMTMILLLGPMIEEKYGARNTLLVILATALAVGIVQMLVGGSRLMGASSVVFAFIILSSITDAEKGEIPLTFILVTLVYIGQQVVKAFQPNRVSEMAHIVGGAVGGELGFLLNSRKKDRRL